MHSCKYILLIFSALLNGSKQCLMENNLIEMINDLNEHEKAEWNLIVGQTSTYEYNKEMSYFIRNLKNSVVLETLHKSDENEKNIYEIFSHKILTIVCYSPLREVMRGDYNTSKSVHWTGLIYSRLKLLNIGTAMAKKKFPYNEVLSPAVNLSHMSRYEQTEELQHLNMHLERLVKSLAMLHFTTVLWIFNKPLDDIMQLQQLSELCWRSGLTNILFFANKKLFTYRPLPFVKVLQLGSWKQLERHNRIVNFHNYPFRFPITPSAPRCYRYFDPQGNVVPAGYFYDILMTFVQQYNFSFTEYPNDYTVDDKEVLLRDLRANKFDVVPFLAYRNHQFWASDVLWNSHAVLLAPKAKPIRKFKYFILPFENITWLVHFIFILLSSTYICFSVSLKTSEFDFSQALLYALSLATYQNHFLLFRNPRHINNIVYMILFLYGFIMVQMYLCKLSSMLVVTIYEPQIRSLLDISGTDLKLYIAKEDLTHFLTSTSLPSILLERMIITDGVGIDVKRRSLNSSLLHMGFEDKINFFLIQQKFLKVPLLQRIEPVLLTEPIFFTMRHNLPFAQLFNRYLKYLTESGLLQKILRDIERHGILSGEIRYLRNPETDDEQFLTLEYFYAPLFLYISGIATSILIFLAEIIFYYI